MNPHLTEIKGRRDGLWASLDSLEGVSAPESYLFVHREKVLSIRTESDGRRLRFVFQHPTELTGTRARRVHRDSKAMIEMEARKAIDEVLDESVAIPKKDYEALQKELARLRALEQVALNHLPDPGRVASAPTADPDPIRTIPLPCAAPDLDHHTGVPPASAPGSSAAAETSDRQSRKRTHKVSWPPKADLLEMLWTRCGTQIARELGCDPKSVFKQARLWDLPRPPHTHWLKRKYGDPIVIPEAIAAQIARLRLQRLETHPEAGGPSHKTL
jgi:hypothetical protein